MINEKYSRRDFSSKLLRKVYAVDGNNIIIHLNYALDGDYVDARIEFISGAAQGKVYRISANNSVQITVAGWGGTVPTKGDKFYVYWDLTVIAASKLNNTEIIGSCFAKEGGYQDVFPEGMTGVTFTRCNLDNCNIPAGNTLTVDTVFSGLSTSNKEIKTENDKEDWIYESGVIKEPISKALFLELGLSVDPNDIPNEPLEKSVIQAKLDELDQGG